MKSTMTILALAAALVLPYLASAQGVAPVRSSAAHTNSAIVPVPQANGSTNRQALVLRRAKDNPGDYDIEFIGDSITQDWEGAGKSVWQEFYGQRKVINLGVGGDLTQNVLWRFEHGQLDGIKARVAVVLIGTNNTNGDQNSGEEILEGVTAVVNQIRRRQPATKIIVMGIFPRAAFRIQRGKILHVNQGLARLDDGKTVCYIDVGPQMVEKDGALPMEIFPDLLHPSEEGYRIWSNAIEPKIKEFLANGK
jgi:lysophospholipase L1-like esterase